jgi:tetracycline 7-halogenase / FADH2 O2-dependent halogenase
MRYNESERNRHTEIWLFLHKKDEGSIRACSQYHKAERRKDSQLKDTRAENRIPSSNTAVFDVAIIGSGIAGSLMGCILARQGLRVVLIDTGVHPRFSLGESTIGETSYMLKVLAARYDVPEIGYCSTLDGLQKHVTSTSGVKRNFGFVYQREHERQNPQEVTQCNVSEFPFGPEMHLYRQDIDSYLFYTAVRYGAVPRQQTRIQKIEGESEQVTLSTEAGETFSVQYVVDASGERSLLANLFQLRENPPRFKTRSRTLFTHMVNVQPYDSFTSPSGQPTAWHSGTLHHLFDGGWLWVIPFDNREGSTNPLCSVGLNLDERRFPKPKEKTPQQEWKEFLVRYPGIAAQFAEAQTVRNWISTERTQFSSRQTVGDRWAMMSHAAGAIDALFSRGLANTTQIVNSLSAFLLKAFQDGDFSAQRFSYIEKMNQTLLDFNDELVHGSYVAFRDFDLWRAWSKVWFLAWNLGSARIAGTYLRYQETQDPTLFNIFEEAAFPGSFCPDLPQFQDLFKQLTDVIDEVESGTRTPQQAVTAIAGIFDTATFVPTPLNLSDVLRQYHDGSVDAQRRMYDWGRNASPQELRRYYDYDFASLQAAFS